ncbi:unnamed protein product [Brachionus calyciflorus]|uniref:Uncharacterized protein n=1 Tax=Brachionus calyciflorus TaxID=104777 RepID=A0A813M534_9BILA|nr:unnamed protein product [Brachionus calyciflorus]
MAGKTDLKCCICNEKANPKPIILSCGSIICNKHKSQSECPACAKILEESSTTKAREELEIKNDPVTFDNRQPYLRECPNCNACLKNVVRRLPTHKFEPSEDPLQKKLLIEKFVKNEFKNSRRVFHKLEKAFHKETKAQEKFNYLIDTLFESGITQIDKIFKKLEKQKYVHRESNSIFHYLNQNENENDLSYDDLLKRINLFELNEMLMDNEIFKLKADLCDQFQLKIPPRDFDMKYNDLNLVLNLNYDIEDLNLEENEYWLKNIHNDLVDINFDKKNRHKILYAIDSKNRLHAYIMYQGLLRNLLEKYEIFNSLGINDFKLLDNGHIVLGHCDNILSIWDINEIRVKRIKRIIHQLPNQFPDEQIKIKKLSENRILYYIKGHLYLLHHEEQTYHQKKSINLNLPHHTRLNQLKYYEDIGVVLSIENSNEVQVWDLYGGYFKCKLEGHLGWIHSLSFLSNTELITGSNKDQLIIWNVSNTSYPYRKHEFSSESEYLDSTDKIRILRDTGKILTQNARNTIRVFNFELKLLFIIDDKHPFGHMTTIKPMCVLPNQRIARASNRDFSIRIFSLEKGELVDESMAHETAITGIKVSENEIVSVSLDSTMKTWNNESVKENMFFRFGFSISKFKFKNFE